MKSFASAVLSVAMAVLLATYGVDAQQGGGGQAAQGQGEGRGGGRGRQGGGGTSSGDRVWIVRGTGSTGAGDHQ